KYSLRPVFNHLIKLLCEDSDQDLEDFKMSFPMNFHSAPIFSSTRYSVPMAEANDNYKIEMLENLRFSKDEKRDSIELAESLAQVTGADLFVQDGFGVVHRAHTSTDAITEVLPSVAGLLLEKEVSTISRAFDAPRRPFVAVMGGAKVGDKLPLIEKFIERADKILIAGAMANTILASRGFDMGRSRVEPGQEEIISDIYQLARQKVGENVDDFIVLPEDVAVAKEFLPNSSRFETSVDSIGKYELALDIGQKTVHKFEAELNNAETIVWNGTVGYAEFDNFANGSTMTAKKIAERTADGALSVVGGGDTSAFVLNWSMNSPEPNDFSLISTGGGAALELMSGAILPGVETLENKL
nr:phosphoglycerate kinase [Candidatus Saccharibacteria bacterium]